MRVALAQTRIVWENKEKNLEKAICMVKTANKRETDIVFFPEMSFTGFSMNTDVTAESDCETIETIRKVAKTYKIAIGFGWVKKTCFKAENHYSVISNEGSILSDYIKIHPFSFGGENRCFEEGKTICSFDYMDYKWTTFICYDLRFPELFQIASTDSDIIVVSANWPQKRESHWSALLKARAIENQAYIFGVNCVGEIGSEVYGGLSSAYDFNGTLIGEIADCEDLLIIDIEKKTEGIRKDFPVKMDRKWSLYRKLYMSKDFCFQKSEL